MSLPPLIESPELLAVLGQQAEALLQTLDQNWPADRKSAFLRVCMCSEFVVDQIRRDSPGLLEMAAKGWLERSLAPGELRQSLAQQLADCADEAQLGRCLRHFRNRQQLRIIWRDLTRQAELGETCGDLSDLADVCIDLSLDWLYPRLCEQLGTPIGRHSGQPQSLVVLGMGKLGARELNLSSDVDLIFAFPEAGETQGARRSLDNQVFFIRLGQRLIKALDPMTVDGFVFRVDMRLRPYGSAGALAFSFAALEQYYLEQGRDWERYAMIKARVVAGDTEAGARLLALLHPFVYRRYLDFSAIESLRAMKQLIHQEVQRKGMAANIKLGAGGIREVEFIAQVFQLIHGGRDFNLQHRELLPVLQVLSVRQYLPETTVAELSEGYRFLRYTEHALQAVADRQTQTLPVDALNQARVAWMLGCANWQAFQDQLELWRGRINGHFQQLISQPLAPGEIREKNAPAQIVSPICEAGQCRTQLQLAGICNLEVAEARLEALYRSPQVRSMQPLGRERLEAFVPRLLAALKSCPDPDQALERVLPLVEAVARRSAYLVLLTENPEALQRLLGLCEASAWVAEQVTHFPMLLDELLNAERLYSPPPPPVLMAELNERLLHIPEDDLEQQMEALRHFKLAHTLRVAASELAGSLPLMQVSDYLTWLAETILEQVLALAWRYTVSRHGQPRDVQGNPCDTGFIVVGYGKVGGLELGYGSDLDLVFIHQGDPLAMTDGARPIEGSQFFIRLGQRIVHLLTTQTVSGPLYEVDMRLRPSGTAGLLVTSIGAYERYQKEAAWTWEHQALVRARVLVGCPQLAKTFRQLRAQILGQPRDLDQLRQEVSAMRTKMREALGTKCTDGGLGDNAFSPDVPFQLKQDAGGIVDLEFMVQYATLAWSHRNPELLRYTDNIRILESLGQAGLLPAATVCMLQEVYKTYRTAAHRLVLQKQSGVVSGALFQDERRALMGIWQELGLNF